MKVNQEATIQERVIRDQASQTGEISLHHLEYSIGYVVAGPYLLLELRYLAIVASVGEGVLPALQEQKITLQLINQIIALLHFTQSSSLHTT